MIFFLTISEFINLIRQENNVLVVYSFYLTLFFTEQKHTGRKGLGLTRLGAVIGLGFCWLEGTQFFRGALKIKCSGFC